MNKNRTRGDAHGICKSIGSGKPCTQGEKCKFSHDRDAYLASKPADLGDRCVMFDTQGRCTYGILCRFHKAHTDATGEQVVNETVAAAAQETRLNTLSYDLMVGLRKHTVATPRANEFITCMREEMKLLQVSSRAPPKTPEGAATADPADPTSTSTSNTPVDTATTTTAAETGVVSSVGMDAYLKLAPREKKKALDFTDKLYLAPLTTVGNLPFRRICKGFGVDITCGEMALTQNLLKGMRPEWSRINRHVSEDIFGVQLCASFPDKLIQSAEIIQNHFDVDFVDINMGCPVDSVFDTGAGSALLGSKNKVRRMLQGLNYVLDCPVTVKLRNGIHNKQPIAHELLPQFEQWGASLATLHGRSRQQRYLKLADWNYIKQCRETLQEMPLFGNGDVLSWTDYYDQKEASGVAGIMIGRGALIKPWIFDEIKNRRHWDISSRERLDILREFTRYGMEHWGSDDMGVTNTRRFLLEWMSMLHRYIPVGLLEVLPQKINERPPPFVGRDDLETLMASSKVSDWLKLTEMMLGPTPADFSFVPKHKSNSYEG
ncbi:hypothetical protein BJ085DRAFT_43555 [Dimargaris cristalligena]|uniref:tRNA-dihydrouridine(47) synthase [NAD(P)(+)] n=1 Tax=Dimargaris cristalligena TaxID=215637 RepID=A0A4P9ZNA9_9FUNG|nr:hypothetical protein BJ085DRAFT_43555 [Dimargaris cristalligena]|eukprot:RKP34807.1 hypothetical protein BJ085DRAFT_43555 [Dimargaris cristalligena]